MLALRADVAVVRFMMNKKRLASRKLLLVYYCSLQMLQYIVTQILGPGLYTCSKPVIYRQVHGVIPRTPVRGIPPLGEQRWWCIHRHNLLGDVTTAPRVYYHLIQGSSQGTRLADKMDTSPAEPAFILSRKPSERIETGINVVQAR